MEGRPPAGVVFTDQDIRAEVAARLRQMTDVDARNISVDVQACMVTLTGSVRDAHARRLVCELVQACPGVQDVDNRIQVRNS